MQIMLTGRSHSDIMLAPQHRHPNNWEIILNIHGSGISEIQGEVMEFRPGFISLCPPDADHGKSSKEGFADVFVEFTGTPLVTLLKNRYFYDDEDKTVEHLLIMIHKAKRIGQDNVAKSLLEVVLSLLAYKEEAADAVQILADDIRMNFSDYYYSCEDTINKMNYNNDYIRRSFKKKMSMTPVEFLNYVRISNAKNLLAANVTPIYSVSEVAFMSGYYDAAYFSRIFKKLEGVSPKKYALSIREKQADPR